MSAKITLNRKIQIQSVVTPKLKTSLLEQIDRFEAQETQRLAAMEARFKDMKQDNVLYFELQSALMKTKENLAQLPQRKSSIEALKEGDIYNMGTMNGMVNLGEGDDFFAKTYGVVVLLKDGKIESIKQQEIPIFAPVS